MEKVRGAGAGKASLDFFLLDSAIFFHLLPELGRARGFDLFHVLDFLFKLFLVLYTHLVHLLKCRIRIDLSEIAPPDSIQTKEIPLHPPQKSHLFVNEQFSSSLCRCYHGPDTLRVHCIFVTCSCRGCRIGRGAHCPHQWGRKTKTRHSPAERIGSTIYRGY